MTIWSRTLALAAGCAFLAAAAGAVTAGAARADAIDDIRKSGKLVVGVKTDYAPYGFLGADGRIVGLEPDLAGDVAAVLGVGLELVPVVASDRLQLLEDGRIDLIIATMADREERSETVLVVDPGYYASGANVLTRGPFVRWEDLKGEPVCGIQGAFANRRAADEFGAEIVAFKGTAEALTALRQNRCVAFVYEDSFIVARLAEPDWQGWKMPLPSLDEASWGLAVRKGEAALAALMSGMVVQWHLSGRILELERKYGLQPTAYAARMHELFSGLSPAAR